MCLGPHIAVLTDLGSYYPRIDTCTGGREA